ncbi:CPBP family intramembrane metalloprotease [Cereibacter azotoformans]|uniref:Abortive infection protein n=1 Tax=Cereibacter sphaeroides (strain ATCC 17025 / ATH 2.4.3) TaxID=349102 RepID=A4WPF6_CERS5|nr:CPBP family intramembrane glutamic endopeptidase [Cereibacter azotoformans]ULB08666.1 CPBP family intramembrane metalloprotease [Cereibacter azotoformans]
MPATSSSRTRLWAEFVSFYLFVPVVIALFLPPSQMFLALFAFTALGLVLLGLTPDFDWSHLVRGWRAIDGPLVAGFALATLAGAVAIVLATRPERLFDLARDHPAMLVAVLLLYPFLSVLPQEVIFRPLFFRRYGALLPPGWARIVINAALFSLVHLMYWSGLVALLTFCGGLVFGWAYETRRSFPMAVVLHAVAGGIMFAAGLGAHFVAANAVRPF